MIKVCVSSIGDVPRETMTAVQELMRMTPCEIQLARGRHLPDMRNALVCPDGQRTRYAKLDQRYSHFLMVDECVSFTPAVVLDMLDAGKDVIGAAHDMPDGVGLTAGRWADKHPGWIGDNMSAATPTGVYHVDWVADSLLLVKREAFELCERPWWRETLLRTMVVGPDDKSEEIVDVVAPEIGLMLNFLAHKVEVWAMRPASGAVRYAWAPTEFSPIGARLKSEFTPSSAGWTGSQSRIQP